MRSDEYITRQIERTRRSVKIVDVATSLLAMAAGLLGVLLVVAVIEHWLVPGGLSFLFRGLLFLALLTAGGYYAWRHLWPYVVGQVNPIFAAVVIERAAVDHHGPSLKNSLLNLLLLGRHREQVPATVYSTLEEQAARGLSRVEVDEAVDRTQLIRVAIAFAALLVTAAAYKVFSPKDPLLTAGRVLMPWADLAAPSRVQITDIEPGTITITRGETLPISATVRGLGPDEDVLVRYTTDDNQAVDRPVAMRASESGLSFACELPAEERGVRREKRGEDSLLATRYSPISLGVQRNLTYRIEAGDARSRRFTVTVIEAPTISVTRVDYDYPEYTGFFDRTLDGLGDIRAIEGTKMTLHARANGPIEEAYVDFEADGRRDLTMQHKDEQARGEFTLALRADRRTPEHTGYVLQMVAPDGRRNRDPVRHTIDVQPDYGPEIELLAPREKVREIRLNETVTIEVEGRDPDFALAEVQLVADVAGRRVVEEPLLDGSQTGRFVGRFRFTPSRHGLRAGDVVEYWATARDNRTPEANFAASNRQRFKIVAPEPNRAPNENQMADRGDGDAQRGEGSGEKGDGEARNAAGQGERGESGQQGGERGQQSGNTGQQQGEENEQNGDTQSDSAAGSGEKGESGATGEPQASAPGENQGQESEAGRQQSGNNGAQPNARDGQPGGAESESPVSAEGDDDGEAFERMAEHFREDASEPGGGERGNGEPEASATGEEASTPGEKPSATGEKENRSQEPGTGDHESGQSESQPSNRDAQPSDSQPSTDDSQPSDSADRGAGAETRPGDSSEGQSDSQREREPSESPGGQQTNTTGPSGAGDQPGEEQGAPTQDGNRQPREKRQQRGSDPSRDDGESPMPGQGKRESDSAGDQGGDKAGGGQEGGGQQAPRQGTGSSGQNESADEGTGESAERGAGRTSSTGGDDVEGESAGDGQQQKGEGRTANGENGEPEASEPGENGTQESGGKGQGEGGEQDRGAQNGSQPGAEARDGKPGEKGLETGDGGPESGDRGEGQQGDQQSPQGGSRSGAGGTSGNNSRSAADSSPGAADPGGDPANLEYARRQTDLILDKLSDMLKKRDLDESLLDKLGWSEDDLRKFVNRWQSRKQQAERRDPTGDAARRELEDALRTLPPSLQRRTTRRQDTMRDLKESVRVPVPPEFRERLKAYNQGVSRAREE